MIGPPPSPPLSAPVVAALAAVESDRRRQLERALQTLYKRKWITLAFLVATVGATALYTLRQPKLFRASTTIIIDLAPPRVLKDTPEVAELGARETWRAAEFFNTEFAVIRGGETAAKVVDKLGLARDASFVGTLAGTPEARTVAIGRVRGMVSVDQVPDSDLAEISVTSTDPSLAALLSDAVADAYITLNLDRRIRATTDAVNWLADQSKSMGTEVVGSEDKLLEFKKANILVTPRDEGKSIAEQRLIEFSSALNAASLQRIEIEARRRVVADFLKPDTDTLAVSEDAVIGNTLIQSLKAEWVTASKDMEALKSRYGPEHPAYKEAAARVKFLRENIDREVRNVLDSIDIEWKRAKEKEESVKRALDEATHVALETAEKEAVYERLKRESATSEKMYELLVNRHKETLLSALLTSSNVRVHERATVPTAPVYPKVSVNMLLSIVIGLLGGILLAFGAAQLDNTIKNHEEIEQRFGLDFLGLIPEVEDEAIKKQVAANGKARGRGKPGHSRDVDLYVWNHPKSTVAESCRTIRTNLLFKSAERGLRRILVTSAGPEEGKTVSAIYLATTLAAGGGRTLLIDTDMRRPRLHRMLDSGNDVGLSSVILGEVSIEEAVVETAVPGLYLLRCGPLPPNPADIFGSGRFRAIVDDLGTRFDRLVFDSPPVIAVSDPLILSALVDGVVLVARAGVTTRDLLETGLKRLRSVRANIFGCVLNAVDVSRKAYGYYYTYYARYGYYMSPEEAAGKPAPPPAGGPGGPAPGAASGPPAQARPPLNAERES